MEKRNQFSAWLAVGSIVAVSTVCVLFVTRTTQIQGQAFLVVPDGTTIKLGAVEVRVVKESEAKQRLKTVQSEGASNVVFLTNARLEIEPELATARRRTQFLTNAVQKLRDTSITADQVLALKYERLSIMKSLRYRDPKEVQALESEIAQYIKEKQGIDSDFSESRIALEETRRRLAELEARDNEFNERIAFWKSPRPLFVEGWLTTLAASTTDADGRFVLKAPKRRGFWIAALATRKIGNKTNAIGWLRPIDFREGGRILLSDENALRLDHDGHETQ